MALLLHLIPDVETLLNLDTSELAGYLLRTILDPKHANSGFRNRRNVIGAIAQEYTAPRCGPDERVTLALAEAHQWLVLNGFLAPAPENDAEWYAPSRRAKALPPEFELKAFAEASEIPEHFLDPEIVRSSRSLYLQGRLDTAVFEAFKALEIEIRDAAGLGADLIGTKLTGQAFHPERGPLTDMDAESSERQALQNLMSGALGSYKNPHSHRRVAISREEAREMLILASHLIKVVKSRRR